ncbi:MAG: ribonuclease HII, partial [Bacteroidetes bacterium]|nr:ribonuclease HII [Bacteroidota bacterium]
HRIDATSKTLVTLSENKLNIKGITVKLPYGEYTPPKIFYLNNTLYFSTTDKSAQKVYLYYSDGTAVEGFPVYGNTAVDLANSDRDKALEMVVATEDNSLLIYEIN